MTLASHAIRSVPTAGFNSVTGSRALTTALLFAGFATSFALGSLAPTNSTIMLLLPIAGVLGACLFLVRPSAAVVVILVLGATFLPIRFGSFEFAGVRSDLTELAVFALLGTFVVRRVLSPGSPRLPFMKQVLLILGAAGFGAAVAVVNGSALTSVLHPLKTFVFWALVLPLAATFRTEEQLDWLERLVVGLAVVSALTVLILAALGVGLYGTVTEQVQTLDVVSTAQRIRPEALQLGIVAVLLLVHQGTFRGWTALRAGSLVALLLLQFFSFNRSSWVALVIALFLYVLLRPARGDSFRGLTVALAAVIAIAVGMFLAAGGFLGPTGVAMAARLQSVVTPSVFAERSQALRNQENSAAINTIKERPVTGVGLNRPYSLRSAAVTRVLRPATLEETRLLHNSYLKLWLETGLAGMVAVSWLASSVFRAARRRYGLEDIAASRALAAGLALLTFALQALYQTKLYHRSTILAAVVCLSFLGPRYLQQRAASRTERPHNSRPGRDLYPSGHECPPGHEADRLARRSGITP